MRLEGEFLQFDSPGMCSKRKRQIERERDRQIERERDFLKPKKKKDKE